MDDKDKWSEFYRRYYLWCLGNWKRELSEDFPLLRTAKIERAGDIIAIILDFPKDEIWNICMAIVKKKLQHKLMTFEELFTEQDQYYHQLYCEMMRKKGSERTLRYSKQEEFLDGLRNEILQKTPRKVIRKKVIDSLYPVLGDISEKHGTVGWVYETRIGPWNLTTWIDTGGRSRQLGYSHSIIYTNKCRLFEGISLERWLGIGGSETKWNNITEENLNQVVSGLTQLIAHFLNAAPKLLEGIEPE